MIIAITGYIGSGKTTASGFFKEHGYRVINVDELGHELIDIPEVREKLKAGFGISIMGRDFKVDREKLSKAVFNDTEKLMKLNAIVHPFLKQHIKSRLQKSSENTILDVALFKELNLDDVVEKVILIEADITKIYERLSSRYTKKEIINVMNSQQITAKPDIIIENNATKEELRKKVEIIIKKL